MPELNSFGKNEHSFEEDSVTDPTRISRRGVLKTGMFTAAAAAMPGAVYAVRKQPGETLVLACLGDDRHNGAALEQHIRTVIDAAGWRLRIARSGAFVTPGELAEADLFILGRGDGPDTWSPEPVLESPVPGARFMTAAQEQAVVTNVRDRGMGLVVLHGGIDHPERRAYLDLLGLRAPAAGVLPERAYTFAPDSSHPITLGAGSFDMEREEISAIALADDAVVLFKTAGVESRRCAPGGWCRMAGSGRVAVLLPGHDPAVYGNETYTGILRRAAQWAMGRMAAPQV
jgi:hypothetical protein